MGCSCRIGSGNYTPSPSQIPDLILSRHPARATARRLHESVQSAIEPRNTTSQGRRPFRKVERDMCNAANARRCCPAGVEEHIRYRPWELSRGCEGGGVVLDRLLRLGAGVVDGHVQAPAARDRPIDETADVLFVSHVGLDKLGLGAEPAACFQMPGQHPPAPGDAARKATLGRGRKFEACEAGH
jgi:hypothetical protein